MKPRSVLLKLQSSQNMHVLRRAPAAPGEPAAPAQPAAPVQWTDNMEKMEKMVQETASGSHERKTVRPLQARPTHFLAMRVSSSRVKEVIGQVHGALEAHSPGLAPALESPMKAHVTLGVMCLRSQQDIAGAIQALHKSAEALSAAQALKPLALQVRGLGSFGNSVLFLNIHGAHPSPRGRVLGARSQQGGKEKAAEVHQGNGLGAAVSAEDDATPAEAASANPTAAPPAAAGMQPMVAEESPLPAAAEAPLSTPSAQGHGDDDGGLQGYTHLHTITSTLTTCFAGIMTEEGRAFKPHITVCKTSKLKHGRGRSGGHGRGRGHAKTESNRGGLQQCMREGTELGTVSEIAPEQHKEDQVEEGLCSHGEDSHQQEHVQQWQPHKERISLDASNPGNMCVSHDSEPQDHDSVPRSKDNHAASKRDSGQGREEEVPNKRMRTAWSEDVGLVYTEAAASLPTPALVRDPLQHDSAAPTQLQAPASFHAPPPAAWTTEMNPSPGQPAAAVAAATATAPSLSTWGSDDRQGHVVGSQFQQQPHNLVHEGPDFEHPKPAPPQQGMAKEEIQALRRQRKERQHNEKQRKRQQQQQKKQQQEQQPVRQHRDQRDHGADVRIHEQNEQSVRELPVRGIPREAYQAFLDVDAGGVVVEEVLLCSMAGKKQEDGFYQVVASLPLHPSALSIAQHTVQRDQPETSTALTFPNQQAEAIQPPGPGALPASLVAPDHVSTQHAPAGTAIATELQRHSQHKRKWCCLM